MTSRHLNILKIIPNGTADLYTFQTQVTHTRYW